MNVKFQFQRDSMTSKVLISFLDYFGLIDFFLKVQQQTALISNAMSLQRERLMRLCLK